jgi:hypothetical protein
MEKMAASLSQAKPAQQVAHAQAYLQQVDPEQLRHKISQRGVKIPWLVARPVDTLAGRFVAPPLPIDFSVVAADGSTIPPDRHSSVRYYLLSIGYAALTYGSTPNAILDSWTQFCFSDDDLYFEQRIPIEGTRLGILMSIEEMVWLHNAALLVSPPATAICDGSLILWNLENEETALKTAYLKRFLDALDALQQNGVPVCSYISYPGGQDVVNSLRLMLCDAKSTGCAKCPQETDEQTLCQFMGTLRDRQLYNGLLEPGQRSDVLESQSAILDDYGPHRIQFFYLNVGDEIVRVEAPQWVMRTLEMIDLVQGAVIDQCKRSGQYPPYPPALIEAHEQAVISTTDRMTVERLVEQALAAQGVFYVRSAKDRSKRRRGV